MNQPLVSVLMPCYNVENYVEESLDSVLNQTYGNIEIIAVNDCSTDRTGDILDQKAKTDNRIKVYHNAENLKLIRTLNKGVILCNGEYIARMDSDDIAFPERIEKELRFLEENKDHDIVSSQFYAFNSEDHPRRYSLHHNPTKDEELRAYLLFKNGVCHPAVMIRKRVFTELNLSFEMEYLHVEDFALWSKAIYLTKIANLEEPLLYYRIHAQQVSSLNEQQQLENKKKVFKIHCQHLDLPYSDEDLDIYASVAECVPSEPSLDYLNKCEAYILSLLTLNKQKPFCNHAYLEKLMSIHWLRLCANSRIGLRAVQKLKESRLYVKKHYTTRYFVILYAKCIFKLSYNKSFIYRVIFR